MVEFEDAGTERMAQLEQEDLERYQRDLDLQRRIVRMRRPIQRFEMRVPDYYTRFCYWKEEMISLGYPDDESSLIDDFIGNLQWHIQLRVSKRRSRISRLVDAYYEAKFEETTILLERMVKDLKAATEIKEMNDRFLTEIQGDGIFDSVDEDSIVNNQPAIPYVQTPKANVAEPYAHKSFDDMPRSLSIELKEEDADSDGSGNCDEQHPDEEIQSNDSAIKNAEDGNHLTDKLLPNLFVKYEETELNGENGCAVWCKTDAHIDADKVFVEMTEPALEEGLLGIDTTKATHYMLHLRPMISPIDSDADWYEKYASLSSFPYTIEPSNGDNANNWVSGSLTNISKLTAQDFSYEDVVLGYIVTKFPLLSLLEFSPQVFDPGTVAPFKQDCENGGQLHCEGHMVYQVAFSHRFEYVNQASRNLFDNKSKRYSSKQKFGVEGLGQPASETWESYVSNFLRDLCFKDDGTIMFVPGISPLHLTGCAPLNSVEMSGSSVVALSIAKVIFCFNPDGCCLSDNECDHFEFNIDLYVDSEVKGAIYDSAITSSNLGVVVFDVVVQLDLPADSDFFQSVESQEDVLEVVALLVFDEMVQLNPTYLQLTGEYHDMETGVTEKVEEALKVECLQVSGNLFDELLSTMFIFDPGISSQLDEMFQSFQEAQLKEHVVDLYAYDVLFDPGGGRNGTVSLSIRDTHPLFDVQRVIHSNLHLLDGFKPSQSGAKRCNNTEHLNDNLLNEIGVPIVTLVDRFSELFGSNVMNIGLDMCRPKHFWLGLILSGSKHFAQYMLANDDDNVAIATLEDFIWDPGRSVTSFYILEDKDVFKRVGKRILAMVMIISIKDEVVCQLKICNSLEEERYMLHVLIGDLLSLSSSFNHIKMYSRDFKERVVFLKMFSTHLVKFFQQLGWSPEPCYNHTSVKLGLGQIDNNILMKWSSVEPHTIFCSKILKHGMDGHAFAIIYHSFEIHLAVAVRSRLLTQSKREIQDFSSYDLGHFIWDPGLWGIHYNGFLHSRSMMCAFMPYPNALACWCLGMYKCNEKCCYIKMLYEIPVLVFQPP